MGKRKAKLVNIEIPCPLCGGSGERRDPSTRCLIFGSACPRCHGKRTVIKPTARYDKTFRDGVKWLETL